MRVKLLANELVDGEIDLVSLVKHGANRSPFKIVKMDDLPEGKTGLMDKITSLFGEQPAEVSAFFVKNEEVAKYEPILKNAGFKIDDTQKLKEVTIYKQDNFDGDADVSLIAINDGLGLALDRVVKQFSSYPESTDFNENLGAAAFFPGLHNAFEALAESVWNALNKAENLGDAGGMIDKNLMAFRKHVNALVKNMPSSVIKIDSELLRSQVGGSTLTTVDGDVAKTEDKDMTRINEAVAGDLGGLNDTAEQDEAVIKTAESVTDVAATAEIVFLDADGNEITEEAFNALAKNTDEKKKGKKMMKAADGTLSDIAKDDEATKEIVEDKVAKASPGDPVVEQTSDTGAVDLNEGLPAGFREVQKDVMKLEDGKLVKATAKFLVNDETSEEVFVEYVTKEAAADKDVDDLMAQLNVGAAPSLESFADAMRGPLDLIGKSLNKINERLTEQDSKIETLQKSTNEAIEKADDVTLIDRGYDLDQSFGLLNGIRLDAPVVKQDKEDIFKGLCPELDRLEESFKSQHGLD